MKYKRAGVAAVVVALIGAVLAPMLIPKENRRVHQHLVNREKGICTREHAKGELCTHLPLVVIDTGGVEIPGKPLSQRVDKDGREVTEYSKAADGNARISEIGRAHV